MNSGAPSRPDVRSVIVNERPDRWTAAELILLVVILAPVLYIAGHVFVALTLGRLP